MGDQWEMEQTCTSRRSWKVTARNEQHELEDVQEGAQRNVSVAPIKTDLISPGKVFVEEKIFNV